LPEPLRVLFVCLGNICRSPLAEALVRKQAVQRGLDRHFVFGSAGTGDWNLGLPADPRIVSLADCHGLDLSRHRATQISARDIASWHWFVAMDNQNRSDLLTLKAPEEKILMMSQFAGDGPAREIPDPYNGTADEFDRVYAVLQRNADLLLDYLL